MHGENLKLIYISLHEHEADRERLLEICSKEYRHKTN